jgi:hypothetical protein
MRSPWYHDQVWLRVEHARAPSKAAVGALFMRPLFTADRTPDTDLLAFFAQGFILSLAFFK